MFDNLGIQKRCISTPQWGLRDFDNFCTGPLTYSDLLSPNEGGRAELVNVWTDSDLQESEHFLAGIDTMDGNRDESYDGKIVEENYCSGTTGKGGR